MKYFLSTLLAIAIVLTGTYVIVSQKAQNQTLNTLGGMVLGSNAATTTNNYGLWATIGGSNGSRVIKGKAGTLSGVQIQVSTAGSFNLYDATTTNHGDYATTSPLYTVIPNQAAGWYPLDVPFTRGLLIEFQSTNVASSTILSM